MNMFEAVTRKKAKLRMALTGVSGAGKTLGALYIAYGITGNWSKVALIDTEHERGRFYANRSDLGTGTFLYYSLVPPYSPQRYQQAVFAGAQAVGPDGVVIIPTPFPKGITTAAAPFPACPAAGITRCRAKPSLPQRHSRM